MKNFITFMFVGLLFLAISCGDKEKAACDTGEASAADVADAGTVSKDCQDLCARRSVMARSLLPTRLIHPMTLRLPRLMLFQCPTTLVEQTAKCSKAPIV